MNAYCVVCKKERDFSQSPKDDKYYCTHCWSVFVPFSRKDRRFNPEKHTWEDGYKKGTKYK